MTEWGQVCAADDIEEEDVIRFDQLGGGIDYKRWPLSNSGKSLYWNSLNKGKRSIAVDLRSDRAKELLSGLVADENGTIREKRDR